MDRFEEFSSMLKSNDGKSLKDMIDEQSESPYALIFADDLAGKLERSKARQLFESIYGDRISTQSLTKKLAVHGIQTIKSGVMYYAW